MNIRSVRNNNPGNLERSAIEWQGLALPLEMTQEQRDDHTMCVFINPSFGFRALAIDLHTKWQKHGLRTINQILEVYAPPSENDTKAYAKDVSTRMGLNPDTDLNLDDHEELEDMCKAIAIHEAGGWKYSDSCLVSGVDMAVDIITGKKLT